MLYIFYSEESSELNGFTWKDFIEEDISLKY
jgi:hypothetical protein